MSRIYSTLTSTLRNLSRIESDRILTRGASVSLAMRIGSEMETMQVHLEALMSPPYLPYE